MIAGQPGGHDLVRGPHLSPRSIAVKRLDDYAHSAGDNPHPLELRLLEQFELAPDQPAKVRNGDVELPRRRPRASLEIPEMTPATLPGLEARPQRRRTTVLSACGRRKIVLLDLYFM
jgi:hypothetical protein